jgi:ABC-type nitrate/sulfonate/bicarbonate transport system substrate-binding protein
MYQTARWAKTHHDESAAILEKYAKIPPDLLHSMSRAQYAERMNLGDMQAVLDVAVRYGLLAKPVRAADLVVTV